MKNVLHVFRCYRGAGVVGVLALAAAGTAMVYCWKKRRAA